MLKQFVMSVVAVAFMGISLIVAAADTAVLIISHEVADFAAWKKRFDEGRGNRDKAGLKERYVMRDAEKPNFVIVVLESSSLENAKKYVADPGFKERINKASVSGTADIKIGTTTTGAAGK